MSDARRKAVETVAERLNIDTDFGRWDVRDLDTMLAEAGLVAVDPALVEAVREADAAPSVVTRGHPILADGTRIDDPTGSKARSRLALADAVLAQLRAK